MGERLGAVVQFFATGAGLLGEQAPCDELDHRALVDAASGRLPAHGSAGRAAGGANVLRGRAADLTHRRACPGGGDAPGPPVRGIPT
ncbi:hypothetical protein EES46_29240 [Streptomyces sp. ADI98-10]|uniref:hypothetical protein n=1 Tax=Streptomyces anulatus TaxID=1892 RepID=UPI000F9E5D2C|nr:hypothetical protein [Streptomyces anulatus]RPK81638.1 hypothetical protein EES46_29240 [Streptomyces sp. ADI98-10]